MTVWLEIGGKRRRVELGETFGGGAVDGLRDCTVDGRAVMVDVRFLEPGVMSLLIRALEDAETGGGSTGAFLMETGW